MSFQYTSQFTPVNGQFTTFYHQTYGSYVQPTTTITGLLAPTTASGYKYLVREAVLNKGREEYKSPYARKGGFINGWEFGIGKGGGGSGSGLTRA